jgi:hypothetical protein
MEISRERQERLSDVWIRSPLKVSEMTSPGLTSFFPENALKSIREIVAQSPRNWRSS